jgi:hypothetical protein
MEIVKFLVIFLTIGLGTILDDSVEHEDGDVVVFKEIVATDSTIHWYAELEEGRIYCWKHLVYETLKIR